MFRDEEFSMPASGILPITISSPQTTNDNLSDVFGSAPNSPTLTFSDHDSNFDEAEIDTHPIVRSGNREISDIPRLKEKHETEGYRDGVTKGKAESVQVGFDEGYTLGAVLGIKIGQILGMLEGISAAVTSAAVSTGQSANIPWSVEKERLETLIMTAKEELKTEKVFAKEWWGEDGIWKFPVPGEDHGRDVVFPDVAAAHPLIQRWETIIQGEILRWSLDSRLMESREDNLGPAGGHQAKASASAQKSELNW